MECLFGHRTASHLGRVDVVQEKGSRCDSSSRDRMASPVREVHGACFLYVTHTQGESPLLS